MKDDLQQQVAQFLFEIFRLARVLEDIYTRQNLGGFLNAGWLQAFVGLFPVPGTAFLRAQDFDNFLQSTKFILFHFSVTSSYSRVPMPIFSACSNVSFQCTFGLLSINTSW